MGKKRGEKVAFYKVDFEKAFDSINWKYLTSILHNMGFPSKWRKWILGILYSGRAKVVVNGATTSQFKINRGLRQRDPLSPLLFVIGLEGLNMLMNIAISEKVLKGVQIPNGGPTVSHLFYADDAVFLGEVSYSNLYNLNNILRCFHIISGLRVNHVKSSLFTIGLSEDVTKELAARLKCQA